MPVPGSSSSAAVTAGSGVAMDGGVDPTACLRCGMSGVRCRCEEDEAECVGVGRFVSAGTGDTMVVSENTMRIYDRDCKQCMGEVEVVASGEL